MDYGSPLASGFRPGTAPWHSNTREGNWNWHQENISDDPNNYYGDGREFCVLMLNMDESDAIWVDVGCDSPAIGVVCEKVRKN